MSDLDWLARLLAGRPLRWEAEAAVVANLACAVDVRLERVEDDAQDRRLVAVEVLLTGCPEVYRLEPGHAGARGRAAAERTLTPADRVVLVVGTVGLARWLPAVFRGEGPVEEADPEVLHQLLALVEHLAQDVARRVELAEALGDPLRCPAPALAWLASWTGATLHPRSTVSAQRAIAAQGRFACTQGGTAASVRAGVRAQAGEEVRVLEDADVPVAALGRLRLGAEVGPTGRLLRGERGAFLLPEAWQAQVVLIAVRGGDDARRTWGAEVEDRLQSVVDALHAACPAHVLPLVVSVEAS